MTFHIHTYGCQMNVRDSDAVAAQLVASGFTPANDEDSADLVVVNTCSVREKAEDKAIGKLRLLCVAKRENPRRIVGVMGCMAQRYGEEIFKKVPLLDFSVGARAARFIPELAAAAAAGDTRRWVPGDIADTRVPCGHTAPARSEFVTVLLGCNRRCSYCIVPTVRGPEYSRPASDVIDEVKRLADLGTTEVTLLGQSVLNYGRQREDVWKGAAPSSYSEPFPRLLEAVASIDGIRRIRFTSGHPAGCTEELARAFRDIPQVCPHLHLPVQSGSDRILRDMRRGYTAEGYLAAVERLRSYVPDISITTDIIVGYPGETEEDFEMTRNLMRAARYDNSFIFKYSPRPGTVSAAKDDDVSDEEKDRRDKELLAEQDRIGTELGKLWIGREAEVMVDGPSLRNKARWSGRSGQNRVVIFDHVDGIEPGMLVKVRITDATPQTLYGEISR